MTTRGHHGLMLGAAVGGSSLLFNPARKDGNITLSNGDTRASTSVSGGHYKVACLNPKSSGKWQFEFTVVQPGNDVAIGIVDPLDTFGTVVPNPSGSHGSGTYWSRAPSSCRFYNGGSYTNVSPASIFTAGDVGTGCIDFGTKTLMIKRNGVLADTKILTLIDPSLYTYSPFVALWGLSGNPSIIDINSVIQHPEAGYSDWA